MKAASTEQAAILEEGDPFTLLRKGSHGIPVKCSRLRVHQPPAGGTVVFEVFDAVGGEMTALSQLAKVRDVAGITGYFIEPELDVTKYPEFSAAVVNAVLVRVVSQMDKSNRGQS